MTRSVLTIAILAVFLTAAPRAMASPYQVEGRWVKESRSAASTSLDLEFKGLENFGSTGTLAVGDSVLLHIKDSRPLVTLDWSQGRLGSQTPTDAVTAVGPEHFVYAGRRWRGKEGSADVVYGYLLEQHKDQWREIPAPSPAGTPDAHIGWWISDLGAAADGTLFAVVQSAQNARHPTRQWRSRLFRRDERGWTALPPPIGDKPYRIEDLCVATDGSPWLAISIDEAPYQGVVMGYHKSMWRTFVTPKPAENPQSWRINSLDCSRKRRHFWISGSYRPAPEVGATGGQARVPFVYARGDASWKLHVSGPTAPPNPLVSPPPQRCTEVRALTADNPDPGGHIWLACGRGLKETDVLLEYDGKAWSEHRLPTIEGAAFYHISGLAFDEDGQGWATANLSSGASGGQRRGLLLNYQGKDWQVRHWTWSWWQKRWLGLF